MEPGIAELEETVDSEVQILVASSNVKAMQPESAWQIPWHSEKWYRAEVEGQQQA